MIAPRTKGAGRHARTETRCAHMNRSAFAVPPECAVECAGNLHAPWIMWMALPHQSGRRQGVRSASCNLLAIEDLGIGSGWQQSKQYWALPAVIGHSARMRHGRLYSVKAHHSTHLRHVRPEGARARAPLRCPCSCARAVLSEKISVAPTCHE